MHTFVGKDNARIHYNSDMSGDAIITNSNGQSVTIDVQDLAEFVNRGYELEERDRDRANKLMDLVNDMTMDEDKLVDGMSRNHRTLQQNFTRLSVAWIEHLAKLEPGQYDLRNEASVKLAKELVKLPNWEMIRYLPHV